jgi:uncharacterized membrane protein YccC
MNALELHRLWKHASSDAEWNRQALADANRMLSTMHRLAAEQAKTIFKQKETIEFLKEHLQAARDQLKGTS